MREQSSPFDSLFARYDAWYDSADGRPLFEAEVKCLRLLMPRRAKRWLEVGVGTGRFARALGVVDGIDVSAPMLRLAASRNVRAVLADAKKLPYADASFDGALMVATLCFLVEPTEALRECARVLRFGGELLIGIVPADSSWGRSYQQKAREGHPFYSAATFYTCDEARGLAARAGFRFEAAAGALFEPPGQTPQRAPAIQPGDATDAGFVALRFTKPTEGM